MRYTETLNIEGRELEYIGTYVQLYGLTDLVIDFYYIELVRYDYLSAAAAIAGDPSERTKGDVDKQLRCIADTYLYEGRRVLSGFTHWGSSAHRAAGGHTRLVPDWYIDPKGPTGYVVRDKMYSKYLYGPLSKEEFYRRSVGKGIPEGPSAFTSAFTGVTGIFATAFGLKGLMTPDPPASFITVRERINMGLADLDVLDIFDDDDPRPVGGPVGGPVGPRAPRPRSPIDYGVLLAAPPPPGGGEYPPRRASPAPLPAPPPIEQPDPLPKGGPEEEEEEEEEGPGAERQAEREEEQEEQPEEDLLPTVQEDIQVPTNPAERRAFMDRVKNHIAVGLNRIDDADGASLVKFADQLKVRLPEGSIAKKRDFMKIAVLRQTSQRTRSEVSAFNELYTFRAESGVDYLDLAPETANDVTAGLNIISRKFTDKDLKAYVSIFSIQGTSRLGVDARRKRVLAHYIDSRAADNLTRAEKHKFRPDKVKREYSIS